LVGAEPLDIDDNLLPPECDLPYIRREIVCDELAEIGPEAREAVLALVQCARDETDTFAAKTMRFAAVSALWRITSDPVLSVPLCERLLLDLECWFRRWVVELLEEIAHPAALPALRERLDDSRPEVRAAAERAVCKIVGQA
jgi:HEAT repeat protein